MSKGKNVNAYTRHIVHFTYKVQHLWIMFVQSGGQLLLKCYNLSNESTKIQHCPLAQYQQELKLNSCSFDSCILCFHTMPFWTTLSDWTSYAFLNEKCSTVETSQSVNTTLIWRETKPQQWKQNLITLLEGLTRLSEQSVYSANPNNDARLESHNGGGKPPLRPHTIRFVAPIVEYEGILSLRVRQTGACGSTRGKLL